MHDCLQRGGLPAREAGDGIQGGHKFRGSPVVSTRQHPTTLDLLSVHWVLMQRSDPSAHTASRRRVEASAMDASCSEGPVTSRNKLALTVMDLPQTENVHNTALGAHWAQVTRSNLILTTSNRRHACATLTVARPWAHGPVLRAAALAEAIFVTRGRAPSGPGATPVRTREHGDQSARESLV